MRIIEVYVIVMVLFCVSLLGCTDHRDLYVASHPLFVIKVDWSISQLRPEGATAMIFYRGNPVEPMFNNPYRHSFYLKPASYDIIVFNEVMVSPILTNIDGVEYRDIDDFKTFGAYAKISNVNTVFRDSNGNKEIMIGYNYPDPVACRALKNQEVFEKKEYIEKYINGVNNSPNYGDYDADSALFIPVRVTRGVKIIAHIKGLKSGFRVSGALRGFAEGVLLASRQPAGDNSTYTFNLNSAVPNPANANGYIVVTPTFNTFGPWWNDTLDSKSYNLDIYAAYGKDVFKYSFDVTKSNGVGFAKDINERIVIKGVDEYVDKIREEEIAFREGGAYPKMETIVIEVSFELPEVPEGTDVELNDWGDDVIITVPM